MVGGSRHMCGSRMLGPEHVFSSALWGNNSLHIGCTGCCENLLSPSPHSAPALGFLMDQALSCLWAFGSLVISVGQEFGSSLAGWLWLRVSDEVSVPLLAGASLCEGWFRAIGATSRMA